MPIFTGFNQDVPTTGHSPAQDYQQMQTNNVASYNILTVDHYTYDADFPGQHAQCTFPQVIVPPNPPSPSGVASILYTAPGTVDPNSASLLFKNQNAMCSASGIRAFTSVSSVSNPGSPYPRNINLNPVNYFGFDGPNCVQNFTGISPTPTNIILPLLPGQIFSSNVTVIVTTSNFNQSFGYSVSPTSVIITTGNTAGIIYNVLVLQA